MSVWSGPQRLFRFKLEAGCSLGWCLICITTSSVVILDMSPHGRKHEQESGTVLAALTSSSASSIHLKPPWRRDLKRLFVRPAAESLTIMIITFFIPCWWTSQPVQKSLCWCVFVAQINIEEPNLWLSRLLEPFPLSLSAGFAIFSSVIVRAL